MCVAGYERAAARFALVAYHSADAHGTVEEGVEAGCLLAVVEAAVVGGQLEMEVALDEVLDGFELCGLDAFVEQAEAVKALLLKFEEQSGKHFLVDDGGVLHPVGHHVVDVFDKDKVGALFVEVLDECTVSAGTEHQPAVVVAYGVVLFVDGNDVGVVFLLGEGDVQFHMEGILVVAFHFGHFLAEEGAVFG